MRIHTEHQSANFSKRENSLIDSFVFHSITLPFVESLNILLGKTEMDVSSHYLIDLRGNIYQLVDTEMKAWHAGKSCWRGQTGLNENSIGFELINMDENGNMVEFTKVQMRSLIDLCNSLMNQYNIDQRKIVAHSDIAPDRKQDPGENFDWHLLSENKIGIYFNQKDIIDDKSVKISYGDSNDHVYTAKKLLRIIGYNTYQDDKYDDAFKDIIIAFKRRYYQSSLDDKVNVELFEIMNNLVSKYSNFDK